MTTAVPVPSTNLNTRQPMPRAYVIAIVVAGAAFLFLAWLLFRPVPEATPEVAPTIALDSLGDQAGLVALPVGEPAMVVFFESWNADSVASAQAMQTAAAESDVTVLAVVLSDSETAAQDFVSVNQLTVPAGFDLDAATADRFGVTEFPAVISVGSDGRIVNRSAGVQTTQALTDQLKDLQAGQ